MSKYQYIYDLLPNCKVKSRYLVDESQNPYDIVSNKGLKRFEQCYVARNGEYSGFCVEAQEDIPSIITNHHIRNALELIEKNSIDKAAISLNIDVYHKLLGDDVVFYVINEWLKFNLDLSLDIDVDIDVDVDVDFNIDELNRYIRTQRHHPINGSIKIIDIGTNSKTKESVVPPEWIGRIFESATELHLAMDELPSKKGKPPVCYCCIYSNSIKRNTIWIQNPKLKNSDTIYSISLDQRNNIVSEPITHIKGNCMIIPDSNTYIVVDEMLLDRSDRRFKTESVGYLSSLLQKCVRRGSHNGTLLKNACYKLNDSPTYNLPDHNFATVSGSRQLLWRAYISIVEDAKGYVVDSGINCDFIDMRSLVLLAIVFQKDPSIKLSRAALNVVVNTMIHLQAYSEMWNWRSYDNTDFNAIKPEQIVHGQITDSIRMAVTNMPMMSNDRSMLERVYTYLLNNSQIQDISEIKSRYPVLPVKSQDKAEQKETMTAGMDMHCRPTMLIELQSMINLSILPNISITPTLERLARYVWDNYSRCNFRNHMRKHEPIFNVAEIKKYKMQSRTASMFDNNVYSTVSRLQEHLVFGDNDNDNDNDNNNIVLPSYHVVDDTSDDTSDDTTEIDRKGIGRIAWLALFGKIHRFGYKGKKYDVFYGGTDVSSPCKMKRTIKGVSEYINDNNEIQEAFLKSQHQVQTKIRLPDPPEGYVWDIKKNTVSLKYDHSLTQFYIDNNPVETLNLYDILAKIPKCTIYEINSINDDDDILISLIKNTTYDKNTIDTFGEELLFVLRGVITLKRTKNDRRVFNWTELVSTTSVTFKIWRLVLARIYTSDTDGVNGTFTVSVGPCDRKGKKTTNSISYQFEGVIFRMLTLLEMLYPFVMRRIKDSMRWTIDKLTPEYQHMISSIESLCKNTGDIPYDETIRIGIITPLWSHQEKTSEKIFQGFVRDKKRGFGDASHVGAGKTLCALSVCTKLYNHNKSNEINHHSGFLVLVPTISLIKTWTDEILKHSEGFQFYVHENETTFNKIRSNTIVVSTMGRMRDHPLQHSWILVIIDECLSVQNKEALQTEEAWRQSCYAQYGIMMLSATFFRSRFDKMLYMLKMLKTGLPEEREYLDAILNESIVSNITESEREWSCTEIKVALSDDLQKGYDTTYRSNSTKGSDVLYMALAQYIHKNVDYIGIFHSELVKLDVDDKKVVIFAKSKIEADAIGCESMSITRYPDKSGTHVVLSLSEGTYGLNDLVLYDTILMRPPEPDKLPQIKGRLDRPGQKSTELSIRYVVLENTIEEASLIRLVICNRFYNNYLMPLAEFYDLAVKNDPNDKKVIVRNPPKRKTKSKPVKKIVKVRKS